MRDKVGKSVYSTELKGMEPFLGFHNWGTQTATQEVFLEERFVTYVAVLPWHSFPTGPFLHHHPKIWRSKVENGVGKVSHRNEGQSGEGAHPACTDPGLMLGVCVPRVEAEGTPRICWHCGLPWPGSISPFTVGWRLFS